MSKISKTLITLAIVSLASYLVIKGTKSTKAINKTLDNGLETIKNYAKLEEVDIGEFKKIMLMKVLPFYTTAYNIENIGYISILYSNLGAMQLFCFILSPFERDFPILTIDYIHIFGTRKALLETYNATLNKDNEPYKTFVSDIENLKKKYSELKDWEMDPQWTDSRLVANMRKDGNDSEDDEFNSIFSDVIDVYMKNIVNMPQLNEEDKKNKNILIKEFSELLVKNGGVAVNFFKRTMSEDEVNKIFVEIFFGYDSQ